MSDSVKAHGMDGTLVEPYWPPLTLAELRPLLEQFPGAGEPIAIFRHEGRLSIAAQRAGPSAG